MVSSMAAPCMACSATIGPQGAAITAHGEGVSPQLVGSNGLLIDPAALSPTPSVTVTAMASDFVAAVALAAEAASRAAVVGV